MKSRITLTIDESLLKQVDTTIDGKIVKNRSHAVELLLSDSLKSDVPKRALLLAGGKDRHIEINGKKELQALTQIDGKTIIEHNIKLLSKHGIKNIIISLGKEQKDIKNYLGKGTELGVNIEYFDEKEPLGTSGAIRELSKYFPASFIVCNSDEMKDIDIKKMYEYHKTNNGKATIALTTVNNPEKYGTALLNGNKISAFVEKPVRGSEPSNLINSGLYILEPEVISLIPEGFSRFEYDVFPKLSENEDLLGFVFSGQWFNIDDQESYEKAKSTWVTK